MRRLFLVMAGFGLARLLFWRRRAAPSLPPAESPVEPEVDPRAEALRAKLDEGRAGADAAETSEPERADAAAEPDPEARRRAVHEAARAAVDEMRAAGAEQPGPEQPGDEPA